LSNIFQKFFICFSVRTLIACVTQKSEVLAILNITMHVDYIHFYLHKHSPKTGRDYSELLQSIFILHQDAVSIFDINIAIFTQKNERTGESRVYS